MAPSEVQSAALARRQGLSLRLRLTLLVVTVFAVISVTLSVVRLLYLHKQVSTLFDEQLRQHADDLAAGISRNQAPLTNETLLLLAMRGPNDVNFGPVVVSVFDESGKQLATSKPPGMTFAQVNGEAALKSSNPIFAKSDLSACFGDLGRTDVGRTVAKSFKAKDGKTCVLAVGTVNNFATDLLSGMTDNVVLSTPVGLLAAAVAGWFVAGLAVQPYQRLSQVMRNLRPDSVGKQVAFSSAAPEVARLQEDLNDALRRLDAGYQAQERFTANVSHELRTPIATVLTEAQTLGKHHALPDDVSHFIRSTQDEMRRLGKMVESFLLLSRVRDGKATLLTKRLYPLNELVMDSASHCKPMADMHRVTIRILLKDPGEEEVRVFGDPELLRTMIDNVLRNAIRFSPRESAVEVAVSANGNSVEIQVRDYGPGIPPELLPRLFDRFTQASNESELQRGAGLGLEIAQGIAELHGGHIVAENLPEGGCRFTMKLQAHTGFPEPVTNLPG